MKYRLLALSLAALASGCASMHNPWVRGDFHETRAEGMRALGGNEQAFARLGVLQERWECRARDGGVHALAFWDRANRARAAEIADEVARVAGARSAVLAQRDLSELMGNALRDLESEFDAVLDMQREDEAPAEALMLTAGQKYLVRRMQHSLAVMTGYEAAGMVEAADTFGRDVAQFQRMLDAALNGDEDLGVEPPDNPEVEDSLAQIEEIFTGYVADSAEDVLENVVYRYDAWIALEALAEATAPADDGEPPAEADQASETDDAGIDDSGMDDAGMDDAGMDDAGMDEAGMDEAGMDDAGMDDAGMDDAEDMPEGVSF